jgi:murein DD-endopeptidase MepM/ murein hydrolase activator NlpD
MNSAATLPNKWQNLCAVNELPGPVYPQPLEPKRRCTVTVTEQGWQGSRRVAIATGCYSISELLEKIGRGELTVVPGQADLGQALNHRPTLAPAATRAFVSELFTSLGYPLRRVSHLIITAACAALILIPILYVVELTLSDSVAAPDLPQEIPETGDQVAGYAITDHFRIRPVHPVTGAKNVPHNGVDVATPSGTPIHAVGSAGDRVTVKCWWDVDGGGWVADQTATSFPNLVFQSLHLQPESCRAGSFQAGDLIARTGNSGLGTGEHYDFRVKRKGQYIPPEKTFLEAALTGEPLPQPRRWRW